MTTIAKVRIKGIRGIRDEVTLDLGGKSLLLRGDNGTGKSSIVQAIRWAVTGAPTGANTDSLPPEVCHHRLDEDLSNTRVEIELLPSGRIVFDGGKRDETATDAAGRAYIDACVRSNPFLRRDELVGLLTAKPGDRFKYLERFLDRAPVDALLTAIATKLKAHDSKIDEATRVKETKLAQLCEDGSPPTSVDDVVQRLCAEGRRLSYAADEKRGYDSLVDLRAAIGDTRLNTSASARRTKLGAGIEKAAVLVPPDHPRSVLDPLGEAERKASEADLVELLSHAAEIVEARATLESCPVCEQEVDREDLASRLRARIAVLDDVRRLGEDADALGDEWRAFLISLEELEQLAKDVKREATALNSGRALVEELAGRGESLSSDVLARLETLRKELRAAHDAIPDDVRAAAIGELGKALDAALAARKTIESADETIAQHVAAADRLRAVQKAVADARKDVAEEIHAEIEGLVASFYERIHPPSEPDEVTGAPRIKVKRHGAGTAHLRGVFNKQEIEDPRLLYSDGHLDTVGICIFLALHKKASAGPKLLVLDDIVLSIDLGHSERLLRLVRDEFKDHQVLILSHNERFMHMSRRILHEAKNLTIVRWTLEHGPRLGSHVPAAEKLRKAFDESGSPQDLAHAMIPLLDSLLDQASRGLEVKVPLTRGRGLSVEEYWGPLKKKIQDLTRAGHLPDLTSVLEQVGTPSFFRNALGAHLNAWALETELREVQRVVRGLLALSDALTCKACQTVVHLVDSRNLAAGLGCECKAAPTLSTKDSKS